MSEFLMPSLGSDMEVGTLVEWLKQPGDPIQRGDIVAVVETQKGAIEIEVFEDGILSEIKVQPGTEVPVGTVLALIEPKGTANDPPAEPNPGSGEPSPDNPGSKAEPNSNPGDEPPAPANGNRGEERRITPAARRAAEERGVDIETVPPGPSGVVGIEEVNAAASGGAAPPKATSPRGIDFTAMRKAIAAAMTRSHREIPHYWVGQTIDVTPMFDWLDEQNRTRGVAERLLYAVPLIKAIVSSIKDTPELNGHFEEDAFKASDAVNIGVATALRGGGLIAPAIVDADKMGIDEIRVALADLVKRTRAGRLRSSEMASGTVTLSSLGEDTSDTITPLIYPPQVAIIGCGAPLQRPHIVEDKIVVRRLMNVTVAGDHRVSDGRRASQFLGRLARTIETLEGIR